jgi:hypothetical protein
VQTAQTTITTPIDTEETVVMFVPGATVALGMEFGRTRMRLLPEFRYSRWRRTNIGGRCTWSQTRLNSYWDSCSDDAKRKAKDLVIGRCSLSFRGRLKLGLSEVGESAMSVSSLRRFRPAAVCTSRRPERVEGNITE